MTLLQLSIDLLHGVQTNTHDDQNARATKGEILVRIHRGQSNERNERYQTEVERTRQGDTSQDVVQILRGRTTSANTGDKASVALHVIGDLFGVEDNRDIEVGEADDQKEVNRHVERVVTRGEVVLNPHDPL